jgi:hypothetical protein
MNVLRFQIRLSKVIQLDIPESELGNQIPETLAILTARSKYGFEYRAEVLEETRIYAGEEPIKGVMKIGQKVIFIKSHHSMNPRLKALVGREGIIGLIGQGANKKVLVSFEALYDSWWISPRLLKPKEGEEEPQE